MPDIAMCTGTGQTNGKSTSLMECPKKETCYRFKAKPSEHRQTYFVGLPYDPMTEECIYFSPLYEKEDLHE